MMPPVAEGHALPADVVDEVLRAGLRVIVLAVLIVAVNLHPPASFCARKKTPSLASLTVDVEYHMQSYFVHVFYHSIIFSG